MESTALHHRVTRSPALPLVACSLAGLAMLGVRAFVSGRAGYAFLVWNLLLAWIPLWLAWGIARLARRDCGRVLIVAVMGVWLLFLPNAPYLLTEFVHLTPRHAPSQRLLLVVGGWSPQLAVPIWFDVVMLIIYAWTGLMLGLVAVRSVQTVVADWLGRRWAAPFAAIVCVLCAFGVTLGRFERWNSWDLFTDPLPLLADAVQRVINPLGYLRTTGATLGFAMFFTLVYCTLATFEREGSFRATPRLQYPKR